MINYTIEAAEHLIGLMEQENAALKRVDYAAATALLSEKEVAMTALAATNHPSGIPPARAKRLRDLAIENRDLLALAISVQTRIVQIVARAHAPPKAETPYGARAGRSSAYRASALALSTRA